MTLAERVHIARRFQRAVRIESDLGDRQALEGFVCPKSSAEVLENMAHHASETGQAAFTWTGPYGAGKSSLAVVLGAILNGSKSLQQEATAILGAQTAAVLLAAFPPRTRGWRVLPVSGRRESPPQVIGEALIESGFLRAEMFPKDWSERKVLDTLEDIATRNPRAAGGLAVIVDELGKFLESSARDGTDIHFFQQLAEVASRSRGRLLVIGILHQAFEEYAHRLSRETRDEWAKVQGRFVDLSINSDGLEQIDLLARAIKSDYRTQGIESLAENTAALIQGKNAPSSLGAMLEECWPLHPITACLLGPISRRRFGQNQRSLFAFLNSAEPCGFRDFLGIASEGDLYTPDRLWDYLSLNLEASILVSPDGHRWALASDAIGRCEAAGGQEMHIRILKVIALADLLKERSRLPASKELLSLALLDQDERLVNEALADLRGWSLVAFRKFANAWVIFEGSDFDVDQAVEQVIRDVDDKESEALRRVSNFRPMVAKRHYHSTGALRWFDVGVAPIAELEQTVSAYEPRHGAMGCFFLAIPTFGESINDAAALCGRVSKIGLEKDVVIGLSPAAWSIPALAVEFLALDRVQEERQELQGDRVARTEVLARIAAVREKIESELSRAFDSASWYRERAGATALSRADLNSLASDIADARFSNAPRIHSELLGRVKPSSNAVAARNILLRRMVLNEEEKRLGIEGFPAEGGLYVSLLKETKLHRKEGHRWRFVSPDRARGDPNQLTDVWQSACEQLQSNSSRAIPLSELYNLWRNPPFGIRDGLLPVLALAFLISESSNLSFYREDVFQSGLTELDVDYLVRDAADIQVRWMDISGMSKHLLAALAEVVREMDDHNELRNLEPVDVARGLVRIYDSVHPWVRRSQRLSRNAIRIRQLFKKARDPNRLIFDDMPRLHAATSDGDNKTDGQEIADTIREGLLEMRNAYPAMLGRLRESLLGELQVPTAARAALEELRERSANTRDLGGDHRMEAFIMRLGRFEGTDADLEGLAGMAVNKPVHGWVDPDVDKAMVELADMAQRFVRAEAFAHVKGRRNKHHAMAVLVGLEGRPAIAKREFQVSDGERDSVQDLMCRIDRVLSASGEQKYNVVLAALAEVSARLLNGADLNDSVSANGDRDEDHE